MKAYLSRLAELHKEAEEIYGKPYDDAMKRLSGGACRTYPERSEPSATMSLFYFTFGQRYASESHPKGGHPDGWFTIEAESWAKARNAMIDICGSKWAAQYDDENPPDIKTFPRGELRKLTVE